VSDVAAGRVTAQSQEIMRRARALLPGGVNSPVRAFTGVGGEPFVAARGEGARLWDADGNEYIDYVLSWGPLVLGHAPPIVLDAIEATMRHGTSFGIPTALEPEMAAAVAARMPHVEMMRFVSSGTEATMSAIRLARAATKRERIVKFDGCYHGHADSFLVRAGSGVATLGLPNSPGVPMRWLRSLRTIPVKSPRSSSSRWWETVASSCPMPVSTRHCAGSATSTGRS
jgi:glutamate-1-semialdehyde 2,1-aminomutase